MFIPSQFDAPLEDGVYLNLSDVDYFRQETRGSSDWITMHAKKWGWWWSSPYNPHRKRQEKVELTYGSALHAIMLEGIAAYESRYAVAPEQPADAITKIDEMKQALSEAGFVLKGVSAWKLDDWRQAMRTNLPHVPVWQNIMEDFEDSLGPKDRPGRKTVIDATTDQMLRLMHEVAVGDDHPDNADIRKIFADDEHPPLAEVSVICTIAGIRRRWRFDRMFPLFDLDLKSLGPWSGRPLAYEIGDIIARRSWDIQRADYYFGRRVAYELIRAGKVFGGTIEQRKWLATWPDAYPRWDWVWLVYQKPDPAGRAPILFPVWDDSESVSEPGQPADLLRYGTAKVNSSIAFYRENLERFGLDKPWAKVEPLHYTDENAKPRVFIPHWIAQEEPDSADAYEGAPDDE